MRYGIFFKVHACTVFWFSLVGTKSGTGKVVLLLVKKPSKRKHSSIYSDASFVSHSVVCCCKSDYKSSNAK